MANWVTLKNGVHIDLDDPNNPITGSGSFKDLDLENQIKELEESRKGLSLFDPKRAEITKKINELKQKLAEKTKSESANSVKSNPKTEQMKIRMQVENAKKVSEHQKAQFDIIQKNNPMQDDVHTGIRKASEIMTAEEAFKSDEAFSYPDFTKEDAIIALKTGRIRVYSSKPISQGGFISPSQMMAQDYAGSGKVYSQVVNLEDIAWINGDEGQYAKVSNKNDDVKIGMNLHDLSRRQWFEVTGINNINGAEYVSLVGNNGGYRSVKLDVLMDEIKKGYISIPKKK